MTLSGLSRHCKHHVFPSFHGPDVRRGFLCYLLKELRQKGIDVFIDNDIERSKLIGTELTEAIRGSLIAVVLISRNYASSTWCLDELVEIIKCRDEDKQRVEVIFYEVDPTDVKKQKGNFGVVFDTTCAGKSTEKVERWRKALEIVAQIAGYHTSKYDDDAAMIEAIVTNVSNNFNDSTTSNDSERFVGIDTHIREIESLLSLESDEVRMVGIWGPAGIGKTTIARALYRKLSSKFTHAAIIESIKGKFEQNYRDEYAFMLHLQEQLLSKTLNQKDLKVDHLGVAKARLKNKKVLIVLDDVDDLKQLEAMSDKTCWFGPQSRIIITTKDKMLLVAHKINHIYQVKFPSTSEALEILCLSAFGRNLPPSGFEDMAIEVTGLAGNLPLALRFLGAYLRGRSRDQWIKALPRLRTSLDGEIEKVLRFSYDALCEKDQELFLHIACFFNGEGINDVVECLAESRLNVEHGLEVLFDKCFISIHGRGRQLVVHNLLEQLAKEIVRKQSVSDPGKRQFLVDAQDICDVLEENAGTETIRGIDFDLSEVRRDLIIDERAFEGMPRLQFVRFRKRGLYNNTKLLLPRGLKFKASKLRFLEWDQFPLTCFPREFQPRCLVKLTMIFSKLEKMWEGPIPLPCLKLIDLSESTDLKELPDLSNVPNLKVLNASFCSSLSEISSIGKATSLQELRLDGCDKLIVIPSSIGNAINLEALNVEICLNLVEFPSSIWSLKKLKKLLIVGCSKIRLGPQLRSFPDISGNITEFTMTDDEIEEFPSSIIAFSCLRRLLLKAVRLKVFPDVPDTIEYLELNIARIEEIPPSIQNLSRLTHLRMAGCTKLKVLPTNVNLQSLSSLDLTHCTQLRTFPEISTSIRHLNLSHTSIEEVPSSIWSWPRLVELNLKYCKSLRVIHSFPDNTEDLDLDLRNMGTDFSGGDSETVLPLRINLSGCKILVSLPYIPYVVSRLDASNCISLERIDGFSSNPESCLSFANCSKLGEAARELIELSDYKFALLPGGELPADFDHRAREGLLTVNLDQSPLPLYFKFKACLLLRRYYIEDEDESDDDEDEDDSEDEDEDESDEDEDEDDSEDDDEDESEYDEDDRLIGAKRLFCDIWCVQNGVDVGHGSCKYHLPEIRASTEHLYFLETSISLNLFETDVNFNELRFEFNTTSKYWDVKDFAVQLSEGPDVELVPSSHVPDSAGGRVRDGYSFKRQRLE